MDSAECAKRVEQIINAYALQVLEAPREQRAAEIGSGVANCIKVPVEGSGESRGLSRAFLDTGEGMAECGEIASEGVGERGERGGFGFERKPDVQARFTGHLASVTEGRALCN